MPDYPRTKRTSRAATREKLRGLQQPVTIPGSRMRGVSTEPRTAGVKADVRQPTSAGCSDKVSSSRVKSLLCAPPGSCVRIGQTCAMQLGASQRTTHVRHDRAAPDIDQQSAGAKVDATRSSTDASPALPSRLGGGCRSRFETGWLARAWLLEDEGLEPVGVVAVLDPRGSMLALRGFDDRTLGAGESCRMLEAEERFRLWTSGPPGVTRTSTGTIACSPDHVTGAMQWLCTMTFLCCAKGWADRCAIEVPESSASDVSAGHRTATVWDEGREATTGDAMQRRVGKVRLARPRALSVFCVGMAQRVRALSVFCVGMAQRVCRLVSEVTWKQADTAMSRCTLAHATTSICTDEMVTFHSSGDKMTSKVQHKASHASMIRGCVRKRESTPYLTEPVFTRRHVEVLERAAVCGLRDAENDILWNVVVASVDDDEEACERLQPCTRVRRSEGHVVDRRPVARRIGWKGALHKHLAAAEQFSQSDGALCICRRIEILLPGPRWTQRCGGRRS
eukprot:337822-Rhodomonas_salina.3